MRKLFYALCVLVFIAQSVYCMETVSGIVNSLLSNFICLSGNPQTQSVFLTNSIDEEVKVMIDKSNKEKGSGLYTQGEPRLTDEGKAFSLRPGECLLVSDVLPKELLLIRNNGGNKTFIEHQKGIAHIHFFLPPRRPFFICADLIPSKNVHLGIYLAHEESTFSSFADLAKMKANEDIREHLVVASQPFTVAQKAYFNSLDHYDFEDSSNVLSLKRLASDAVFKDLFPNCVGHIKE